MYYKRRYSIPFKLIGKVSGIFGYLVTVRFFAWLCGQQWLQRLCWKNESALIRKFLLNTGIATDSTDIKAITQRALMIHICAPNWRNFLHSISATQLSKIVDITGFSAFQKAHEKGKGVIFVHYHSQAADFFWPCFSLYHQGDGVIIGEAGALPDKYKTLIIKGKEDPEYLFKYAGQLLQAQKTLKQGGVVHILPDGQVGNRGIEKKFYNCKRDFQPGFAELALKEQVPVLPTCTFLDLKGKLHVKIFEPFHFGSATMSDEEKINMLIDQYVEHLHKCCQTRPWNTRLNIMKRYFNHLTASNSEIERNENSRESDLSLSQQA